MSLSMNAPSIRILGTPSPASAVTNGVPSARIARMGQIQLILGPMFSGKTTELIRRLKRYQIARYECLIVKYAKDVRYDEGGIATHDKQSLTAISVNRLEELKERAEDVDVVGIDEGQFFPDVLSFCERIANAGKTVIIAALDGTFQRKGFPGIVDLVPLAEHVIKLNAVCMSCFDEGSYTKRISADKEVEVIGGADKYMAVCRRCYFAPNTIPASPRIAFKTKNPQDHGDDVSPAKKALFTNDGKENSTPIAMASD